MGKKVGFVKETEKPDKAKDAAKSGGKNLPPWLKNKKK